jgi:hypothetical protein
MSDQQPPVTVRFDSADPLSVRLEPPESKEPELESSERLSQAWLKLWQDPLLRTVTIISVLILLLLGWARYASPLAQDDGGDVVPDDPDLTFTIHYPRYLAPGDEESITITFVNGSPTLSPARVVSATLFFVPGLPIATGEKGGNRVIFDLAPGERKTRTISLRLDEQPDDPLKATLWLTTDEAGPDLLGEYQFRVLPFRNIKTLLSRFVGWVWTGLGPALTAWVLRTAFKKGG